MANRIIVFIVLCLVALSALPVRAAKVAFRLTVKDGVLQQYYDNPDSFPTCREKLGYISFSTAVDPLIRADGERLFLTTEATAEIFRGAGANYAFTGQETVDAIQSYENKGLTVAYAIIYREDWLVLGGPGGPYAEDIRIISPQELADVRAAIAASDLQSKDTVKIIQLLGARVGSHRGDSWTQITNNPALMAHLQNFDGVGTECHIGDWQTSISDGPETLDAMAQITQWCVQNGKTGFVFMGGAAGSYTQLASMRSTYNYLWGEMAALGVEKDRTDLLYFRQGARPGVHLPESSASLTFQVAELIGKVENPLDNQPDEPTSGLVAHWPLDEGSGTTTTNLAGTSFTADLLNGASWGSDATRDSYVVFDGTDDRIATTFTYALADTNNFTWAWWAKKEPTSHSSSIMVGNRYGGTGSETFEFIKMMPSKGSFANTDSVGSIEDYNYTDIAASSWNHYAMVKSGTSYQWYVDGVAQGSPVTINYNETAPLPFLIGGDDDGSGTKVNEHFEGCIDDVVLYRSTLTPAEVSDTMNGTYAQTIPMAAAVLGSPVNLIDGSTWDDGQPPHGGFNYLVPNTGNIKSEDGTSTFGGYSLTVEGGGKFQFRAKHELGETTTVDKLIATGGTSGNFVNLAAGTGNNTTNHLDGTLQNDGFTKLTGYGNSTGPRNIRISSTIRGNGTLHSTGTSAYPHTCTIANSNNTFAGTWESHVGTLVFDSAGAVGTADIEVLALGKLRILGDWDAGATLTVADSPIAEVDVGTYQWAVSNLVIGATPVADGLHTVAGLNALAINPVFTGSGGIRVGPPPVYELIAGWDTWNSGSAPTASVLASNITGTAVTTSEQEAWHANDGRGASADGDWGTFAGSPAASTVAGDGVMNENLELPNATTGGTITFTIANNGAADILLDAFHFDSYAFRPKAARAYELSVLAGGGITAGVIYTSADDEITDVGGAWDNLAHDDIDHSLTNLADHTLGASESVQFLLAFSSGAGDGSGGHDLWVDNVALSGSILSVTQPPLLEYSLSGGDMIFNWTGGGFKVQSRTNLTDGVWIDVPGGDTPPVTVVPTNPEAFFRLIEQ